MGLQTCVTASCVHLLETWVFPAPCPLTYLLKSRVVWALCWDHRLPSAYSVVERLPSPLRDWPGGSKGLGRQRFPGEASRTNGAARARAISASLLPSPGHPPVDQEWSTRVNAWLAGFPSHLHQGILTSVLPPWSRIVPLYNKMPLPFRPGKLTILHVGTFPLICSRMGILRTERERSREQPCLSRWPL